MVFVAVLCALWAGVSVTPACVSRGFNTDADAKTLFQVSQPRIAIDYVGLGWCYYLEEKSTPVQVFKTDHVDEEVDVNLDTGIETRHQYQVVFSVREFRKAHPVSLNFEVSAEWRKNNPEAGFKDSAEWDALSSLWNEINAAESLIAMRKTDQMICRQIYSKTDKPDYSLLQGRSIKRLQLEEYVVRCAGDSGELISKSKLEQLSLPGYNLVRSVLADMTTSPKYTHLQRPGAECRETIQIMEISRGKFLGTKQQKVF